MLAVIPFMMISASMSQNPELRPDIMELWNSIRFAVAGATGLIYGIYVVPHQNLGFGIGPL